MENALLYTFSTIAQALGGAFALLSAFVLYRFQTLDSSLANDAALVKGVRSNRSLVELDELLIRQRYAELLNKIEKSLGFRREHPPDTTYSSQQKLQLQHLRASIKQRRLIKVVFWIAMIVTVVVMAGTVGTIQYAHEWGLPSADPSIARIALRFSVVAFTTCLVLYICVIAASMSGPRITGLRPNATRYQSLDSLAQCQL